MDSLRSILPKVLRKRGLHIQVQASHVTHLAQEWLDKTLPDLVGTLSVERLRHATLVITCRHGVAAQECVPVLPALKEYLRRECGPSTVAEIQLLRAKTT